MFAGASVPVAYCAAMSEGQPERAMGERVLLLVPVAVAAVVYAPVLRNYFVQDDFLNFYHIRNYGLVRFLLTVHGGHSLVTRNFIWWVLYELAGMRPQVFFATMLATHLAVVGLLF